MKKLLLALPLMAGASWAGTTMYSGSQSEDAYQQLIAQLDNMTVLSVKPESWQPGFLGSTAITRIMSSDSDDAKELFRLQHEISHSPVGYGDEGTRVGGSYIVTTLVLDGLSDEAKKVANIFEGDVPIQLTTNITFGGNSSNRVNIASASFNDDDVSFSMQPSVTLFSYDPDGALIGNGTMGAIDIAFGDDVQVELSESTSGFNLNAIKDGVFTGSQTFSSDTLRVGNPASGMEIELSKLTLDSLTTVKDRQLSSSSDLSVGGIESPLPINTAEFGVSINGINLDGFSDYMAIMSDMAYGSDLDTMDPAELLASLGDAYKGLIAPGASLEERIGFTNDGGKVSAKASISFDGDGTLSGYDSLQTVGDLLREMSANVMLDADAAAVDMTPAAMFMGSPQLDMWIVNDGMSYKSDVAVKDLTVNINGNALSLEMMLGEMLDMPLDLSMLTMGR
ncbi:MAG: DUF945 family protein [Granulosicoccus sp.]